MQENPFWLDPFGKLHPATGNPWAFRALSRETDDISGLHYTLPSPSSWKMMLCSCISVLQVKVSAWHCCILTLQACKPCTWVTYRVSAEVIDTHGGIVIATRLQSIHAPRLVGQVGCKRHTEPSIHIQASRVDYTARRPSPLV